MKNMKFKKNHVTLIEVLIATVLTMMLLTSITFLYRQVTLINKESERLQKEQFRLTYLEKRLGSIIPTIISPTDTSSDFYFYTSDGLIHDNQSLVFTYDHGVNLDKNQSNHLLGRLYVDKNNLVLATWVSPKRWALNPNIEMKKEVLLENVSDLNFEFYMPPKKDRELVVKANSQTPDITLENHWHKTWSYKYNQLPPMMKIHFKKLIDNKTIPFTFAFSLPKSNLVIVYDQTGESL